MPNNYVNPNESMQEINSAPAVPIPPVTTPTQQSTNTPAPLATVPVPQNSYGPGNMPLPAMGSVAGTVPTPQTQQTTPTPTISQIMSSLGPSASQYGTQGSSSSANYSDIQNKYTAFAATNAGKPAPATNPMQTPEVQQQLQTSTQQTDPEQQYFDAYSGMNPIIQQLYTSIQQEMSPQTTQENLVQQYQSLAQSSGMNATQLQLMNTETIMNGTQDDISNEITAAGGTATQSQVLALTASRNNVIMKQASFLQNQLSVQQQYVSNVMQYAEADQSEMNTQVSEQTGLLESMSSLQNTMNNNAVSNYQGTLKSLGYNYTSFATTVPASMQPTVEGLLGLAPGTLSNPQELAQLTATSQTQIADMYKAYSEGLPSPIPTGQTPSGSTSTTPSGLNTVVGGIDFGGAATGTQPYASDVTSEVTGVGRSYNDIVSAYGSANPTATQLSSYITNNAPKSQITGAMITSAASQYGINPAVLAATMNNETSFGTAGEALNGTNNPGGVMDPTTGNYARYSTWQEGVNAVALNLQVRSVPTTGSDPTTPAASTNPLYQSFSNTLSTFNGAPYMTATDLTGYTAGQKAQLKTEAAANGIPTLSPKDADAMDAISSAQSDLQDFATFITTSGDGGAPILPTDSSGQPKQYADVTFNEYLQTNNQLGGFDAWEAATIPVLSALKGASSGGGSSRLFSTVSELLPTDTDTLGTALDKISNINQILNNGAKGILGNNAPIVTPPPPAMSAGGKLYIMGSDGTYNEVQ